MKKKEQRPPYSLVLLGIFLFLTWMVLESQSPDGEITTTLTEAGIFVMSICCGSWGITKCFIMEKLEVN